MAYAQSASQGAAAAAERLQETQPFCHCEHSATQPFYSLAVYISSVDFGISNLIMLLLVKQPSP